MTRATWVRALIGAAAALAATALYLWMSSRFGRLGYDLEYDDVTYALDAAQRLDAWRFGGWLPMLRTFWVVSAHSFGSTVQAMIAFAVAGEHDVVLYASNVVVLLAAAAMVGILTARAGIVTFVLCLALALLTPIAYSSVAEYRPDILLGLATAAMAYAFVSAGIDARPRRARVAGLLLGLCLLVKPTFFAHTLALAFMLCTIGFLAGLRWAPRVVRPLAVPPREIGLFVAIGIVVCLPHYALGGWRETFYYFWSNTMGSQGHIWNLGSQMSARDLIESFRPYLINLPRFDLTVWQYSAAALALLLVLQRKWIELLRALALVLVALASATIIVAGRQPSPFFFATFDWLWLFTAIGMYAAFVATLGIRLRAALAAGFAVGLVFIVKANAQLRPEVMPPEGRHGSSIVVRSLEVIRADLARQVPHGAKLPVPFLFSPSSGPTNPVTLRWVGRRVGLPVVAEETHIESDMERLQRMALATDYFLLPDPAREPYDQYLPVHPLQGPLLAWARANPQLEMLDDGGPEHKFITFANRAMTPRFSRPTVPYTDEGAVQLEEGFADDRFTVPRTTYGRQIRGCFALLPGRPARALLRFTTPTAARAELRLRQDVIFNGEIQPGRPVEIVTRFTPTHYEYNCLNFFLSVPPGTKPPHLTFEAFEVRHGS